jgi:acyl-CoA thioester hydrolase
MEGFRFSTDLRVRYSETDAQGVAHNASYLVWFEIARIAYLDQYPGGYRRLIEEGIEATTVESHVRYRAGVRFDDRLRVWARVSDLRGARFRFDYMIERDGDIVADGWTSHACVDAATLRPTRMPGALRARIEEIEASV